MDGKIAVAVAPVHKITIGCQRNASVMHSHLFGLASFSSCGWMVILGSAFLAPEFEFKSYVQRNHTTHKGINS